ncbi:PH domain-containing protein [Candidatus Solirubrobacter pratensis]|uniref:PH domain-containing protein n=1 Tax=Candidatus Solirubrobacter pratensis TaxID=1298857 RepID=UPI0004060D87|nr:PH domain-containing protein [Candidatus Solirubrobacter pratensis]
MDLHPGEDVVFEGHPSWRAVLSFYITGTVAVVVIAVIVALVVSVVAGVLAAIVLFALTVAVGLVKRMSTTYMVTSQRLYIRRGIFSKAEQQTRIDRVQNVNTRQSLLQRVLSVGTVDFDTAGTDDSEFRFVGIADPGRVVGAVDRAQREAAEG